MYSTVNMSLTSWDQADDDFNHTQLDGNWRLLDAHDHSFGRGLQISTPGIAVNSITAPLIAPGAVGNPQLAINAVGAPNIQDAAVGNDELAAGSVFGPVIPPGAITSGMLDPTVLPLGTVLLWYRASGGSLPGGGWEIMDGRPWGTITNSLGLTSGNIPDMRGAFARGADVTGVAGPVIGATGGANATNLSHSHTVSAHSHAMAEHQHGILNDGLHYHTWNVGRGMWTRENSFAIGLTINDHSGTQRQNTFFSMYVKNGDWGTDTDLAADMDPVGLHDHTGNTLYNSPANTGNASPTTDTQLASVATMPQYVGLLFILRCR